ncbi:hypothetical protein EVAR_81312_1 [Eumeta japonica]|uniref:Uncharacterized protein n=1 Tax=Eumeta variegata TaxID=151549 RepID=A0A4C1VZD0_EUMVA|nr:hypothetical protein EVAR_81312_1 [Eumeta japonica]
MSRRGVVCHSKLKQNTVPGGRQCGHLITPALATPRALLLRDDQLSQSTNSLAYLRWALVSRTVEGPSERVEHVDSLGGAEKSRADPTVSPDRVTRVFHCDIIAQNHSNVPKKVSLQKYSAFYIAACGAGTVTQSIV